MSSCVRDSIGADVLRGLLAQDKTPCFNIPSIREYFIDLEYVLGVISDGPTKSFAFRRLGYLSSKFTMYNLLNEYQELADMKVCAPFTLVYPIVNMILAASAPPVRRSFIYPRRANLIVCEQRLLQHSQSRYARPSLEQHEPEALASIHQVQDEALAQRKPTKVRTVSVSPN